MSSEHVECGSRRVRRVSREDISPPRCFEIERRLQERLDIPVFHCNQHSTAVVVQLTRRRDEIVARVFQDGVAEAVARAVAGLA